ncbi:MAG: FHA domain-containing protein [Anaerolineae bacterium]|nr:FHA domain-containing protein [Anaerolineae bacterium]
MTDTHPVNRLGEALAVPGSEIVAQSKHDFQIVPNLENQQNHTSQEEHWRILLTPAGNADAVLPLELRGDVVIGASSEDSAGVDVNIEDWQGSSQGVSTRHVMLRPTHSKIYIMDLRSSSGTAINGLPLGVGWAYALQNNDMIALGHLNVRFRIIQQPR